jgi:hypothetical protein
VPEPSELVVGDETVQVQSSDRISPIDLAADKQDATAPKSALQSDIAATQPAGQPPARAMVMKPDRPASDVGSASWIAQVLAALGGAVAAGSVAWFLIGSATLRQYG